MMTLLYWKSTQKVSRDIEVNTGERGTHTPRQRHARAFWHCRLAEVNVVAISACRCGVLHVSRHALAVQSWCNGVEGEQLR